MGKETRRLFAKTETVDLSDQATFVTNFLLFDVVPLLWTNIYRRGNYILEMKVAEVLRLGFPGHTNLVLISVCCTVTLLKQKSSSPQLPGATPP